MPESESIKLKVWGDYACFTRPEFKVERVPYPIITPSAARGILDAILFKKKTDVRSGLLVPAFHWHIRNITTLLPWWVASDYPMRDCRRNFRRNEIQSTIVPKLIASHISGSSILKPYFVDKNALDNAGVPHRTQRNTQVLCDVAYIIEASIHMDEYSQTDPPVKYRSMFHRRVQKGQCFHHPYFGCREFACNFAPPDGSEPIYSDWNEDLGTMIYDLQFGPKGIQPVYFDAVVDKGILHCDTHPPDTNGRPAIKIFHSSNLAGRASDDRAQ